MGEKEIEAARRDRVRELFLSRSIDERKDETAFLSFFVWLREHHPELLSHGGSDDPYLALMSDLMDLRDSV